MGVPKKSKSWFYRKDFFGLPESVYTSQKFQRLFCCETGLKISDIQNKSDSDLV